MRKYMQNPGLHYYNPEYKLIQIGSRSSLSSNDLASLVKEFLVDPTSHTQITVEEFLAWQDPNTNFLLTIEDIELRKKAIDRLTEKNWTATTFIGQYSLVFPEAHIGQGVIVWPFSGITNGARIGNFATIGTWGGVAHNATVGFNAKLETGAVVAGGANVGDNSIVCQRSYISDGISLPADSKLVAYSALTKTPDKPGVFAGTPARRISDNV
jgi:UDP-3-O-[3-hydroxymyristoyl] glucosamine N-acyltransferase